MARRVASGDTMAPKPVRAKLVQSHGLFGIPLVRQHMMVDDRWTPNSLTEEFKGMTDLLTKRLVFKKMEASASRKKYLGEYRNLRGQCRDGRTKLQLMLRGNNTKRVRNFLINHKDMQRLYQRMPVHMVVDNINQRTFLMRKDRDRLRSRLGLLKRTYNDKLIERAELEDRIKYHDEVVLEEVTKSREFMKKLANSEVRLRAIKTINSTYLKMIQVLRHDSLFYEPILRSLTDDTEDQGNFIKHILYLGLPAIAKFKELSEEYKIREEKVRKSLQFKHQYIANFKKSNSGQRMSISATAPKSPVAPGVDGASDDELQRYVRETQSMLSLKNQLEAVENTIKQVKYATLCSQAKEIFPRIKSQVDSNEKLHKSIEKDIVGLDTLEMKLKRSKVYKGILINSLSEEELLRLQRILTLREEIAAEDDFEKKTIAHIKNRGDAYVLLRTTLWTLNEILRHVHRPEKSSRIPYPNSYLRLPLLKFEMLTMRACAPDPYEQNIDAIMEVVKRKVSILMSAYTQELSRAEEDKCVNEYHYTMLAALEADISSASEEEAAAADDDVLAESRAMQSVPSRKQIKAWSAKLVEEMAKKDEQ